MASSSSKSGLVDEHLHLYNLRGLCWCGAHRDDWLRNDDMLERIGQAFAQLADDTTEKKEKY